MLYPLKFTPFLRPMIWGGDRIAPFKGIETDLEKIGESWEISGHPDHETSVAEGPLAGKTVNQLVALYKGRLVGEKVYAHYGDRFPLLVKFIDAAADLSIQVHPDDAMALRVEGEPSGKTEMWYVIAAAPGGHLYSGLSREITPEEFRTLVSEGRITEVLSRYDVAPGDVFFLPAGRIHAICSGVLLAEIQQTSDLTYRIYDYGRVGFDGKPRALHVDKAAEAVDYTVNSSYRTDYKVVPEEKTSLVDCPFFTTDYYELTQEKEIPLRDLDSFVIVLCAEGEAEILDAEPVFDEEGRRGPTKGHVATIRRGETLLIPATSLGLTVKPSGSVRFLTSYIQ